jgi:TPR repeat protein
MDRLVIAGSGNFRLTGEVGDMELGLIRIAATTAQPIAIDTDHNADLLVAACLAAAAQGDTAAYYDLGVAYSTGSHGVGCDLIEAHKWFNLAAVSGHEESAWCRADIAEEMTAREIAEAQRRAREWLNAGARKAA